MSTNLKTLIGKLDDTCRQAAERAAGPVIHWLSPLAMAVRPSRLMANLTRTNGKPCSMRLRNP